MPGSVIDEVLARAGCPPTDAPTAPGLHLVIVTCMDGRIDPLAVFGLAPGDAHIVRNAGGLVTPHTLRSLVLSQTGLGTREILVAQHTGCGAHPPDVDLEESVRESVRAARAAAALPHRDAVRGAIIDLARGGVREVVVDDGKSFRR